MNSEYVIDFNALPRRERGLFYHVKHYIAARLTLQDAMSKEVALAIALNESSIAIQDRYVEAADALRREFQAFIGAYHKDSYQLISPWHYVVAYHMMCGEKIPAIKETRTQTGYGLKEAKDIIDVLQFKMVQVGRCKLSAAGYSANTDHISHMEGLDVLAYLELAAGV